jgi:hypothetical protein
MCASPEGQVSLKGQLLQHDTPINMTPLPTPSPLTQKSTVDLKTSRVPAQHPSLDLFERKSPTKPPTEEPGAGVDVKLRNRFEPLNDTTDRPKRVFRKTPPPQIIRGVSTTEILGTTTPAQDDFYPSVRRSRFESLNDTTDRPRRVFRKTPPPPRSKDIAALRASTRRFISRRGGMPTDQDLAMLGGMRHTARQMKFEGKKEKLQSPW